MSATGCVSIPQISGEDSILYKGLQKVVKGRPNTNWAYCAYLYPGVADAMDNDGYKRNSQNQHNAVDVVAYLDLATMATERLNVDNIAIRMGAMDSSGNLIDFTDSERALEVAKRINDTYTGKSKATSARGGTVAWVTQNSGIFNVVVLPRDASTQFRAVEVETASQIWEKAKDAFRPLIDLNTLTPINNNINAISAYSAVGNLNGLARLNNDRISERDIRTIYEIYKGDSQVQRLVRAYGSLDDAARATANAFATGGRSTTSMLFSLMDATLTRLKWFPGIDITGLKADADFIKNVVSKALPEADLQKQLEDLDHDYNIDMKEYHRDLSEVKSLSDLAKDMIFTLKREQRELERMQGVTPESVDLRDRRHQIIDELKQKNYYLGILGYIEVALKKMQEVEQLYYDASNVTGTNYEKGAAMVEALNTIKRDLAGYKQSLVLLTNIDSILMKDEAMRDTDKMVLETKAKDALSLIKDKEQYFSRLRDTAMTYVVSAFMGDYAPDGSTIADLVTMSHLDSTFQDRWFYSMARVSNPLIATMGGIINEEKLKGNKEFIDIDNRVTQADNKLKRSKGSRRPKDFMYQEVYDKNGNLTIYIASNIDWRAFKEARNAAYVAARQNGLKDEDLEMHMQQWEEDNTEDRIVDTKNMRVERVPDSRYQIPEDVFRRNTFKTKEEEEYYDTMMQIKGELGSKMPHYAQKQFLPTQKRRTSFDAIGENPMKTGKAILNKIKDTFSIREDDTFFANNGIVVDGQDYGIGVGTIDDTAYRQIPIFYINKLKDQKELLKDFSGSIMALAGTAINYERMNSIRDTIEFMADYISSKTPPAYSKGQTRRKQAESWAERNIMLSKEVADFTNNVNTKAMLEGFVDKFLFGVNVKNPSIKTKMWQLFLKYVSTRSLTANVKGATANAMIGEYQTLIEAIGGEFFSFQDWLWAQGHVFGMNTVGAKARIVDFFSNNKTSKSVLLGELFDVLNDNNMELSNKRFHRGFLRHIFSVDLSFIGYGTGEHLIHYTNMFAILHGTKVLLDGKETTLDRVFKTTDPVNGVSELEFKGRVQWVEKVGTNKILHDVNGIDDPFIDEVRRIVKHVNHQCHGAMNTEDKGLIHQRMVGRSVMSLRQWSIEHYSRRYRGEYYDANLKKPRRGGFHKDNIEYELGRLSRTKWAKYILKKMKSHPAGSLFYETAKQIQEFEATVAIKKDTMTKEQLAAIRKARAEYVTTGLLFLLNFAFPPEDFKGKFFARFWIYQLKRAMMEIGASAPTLLLPIEAVKMVNSPIAGVSTFNSFIYIAYGLVNGDLFKTVQRGKYKDWNKYARNFLKYVVPYYNQMDGLIDLATEDNGFGFFDFRP